ncbi:hypothetical protein NXS19_002211 [Fusarium pseudograminearum]|nr:hypothetical protein NXS19_002211 [Fusarium pseudograminearum]
MTTQFEISFRQWIPSVSKVGVNGFGEESKYVPATKLTAYWSEEQLLHDIIDAINPVLSVPYGTIIKQYLGVFSTLVYLGRPEAIRHFLALGMSDDRLPLRLNELPDEWNHELDRFIEEQWRFCPWRFTVLGSDQRQLPTQQILPIEYKKSLTTENLSSYQAQVRVVKIDKEYSEFEQQEVVFKIYKEPGNIQLYNRETDVYTRLRAFPEIAITECYGSFGYPGTDTWIIILEYTEIGSLLKFFEKCKTPVRPEEYTMLWERLTDLLNGLYLLHNQSLTGVGPLTGIHQDIQPANILVFRRPGNSTYDVVFKLADFGLTELAKKDEYGEGATVPTNTEGNRMYASPEAYSNSKLKSQARPRLSSLTDLWSIGAVFSDFLVWSIGGNGFREDYRIRRRDAIAELPYFKDRGWSACFHDTFKRLPAVDSFHEETLRHKRAGDLVSPRMSEFILKFMMVEPKVRLLAGQAEGSAKKIIEEAQQSPRPGTPEIINHANLLKKLNCAGLAGGQQDIHILLARGKCLLGRCTMK